MAGESAKFALETGRRIAAATKTVEGLPEHRVTRRDRVAEERRDDAEPQRTIDIRLTGYDGGEGAYAWEVANPDTDNPPTRFSNPTGTDAGTKAHDRGLSAGERVGEIVEATIGHQDEDGDVHLWFDGCHKIFKVGLVKDGGDMGGVSGGVLTTCDATYTVKHAETGVTLFLTPDPDADYAELLEPEYPRPAGKLIAATQGLARRDDDGTLVLVMAFEKFSTVLRAC